MRKLIKFFILVSISVPAFAVTPDTDPRTAKYPVDMSGAVNVSFIREKVGTFTHMSSILPHCNVAASTRPVPLQKKISIVDIEYNGIFGKKKLSDHLVDYNVLGITVVKNNQTVIQQFGYDRNENDKFTSFSTAKSFVSILVGIALDDGKITSLDDPVRKYTNRLNNSSYADISIRNLLRMSSGVPFSENYTGRDDISYFDQTARRSGLDSNAITAINNITRAANSETTGKKFNYSSAETTVLAEVITGATGESFCAYFERKLWEPLGASAPATWTTDAQGNVLGYAFFQARHDDYAKFGVMLANNGKYNGKQIVSSQYVQEATNINLAPNGFKLGDVNPVDGYGYQFWLNKRTGRFVAKGYAGQYILVDRPSNTVMVVHSVWATPQNSMYYLQTLRLFNDIVEQLNIDR